jgi:hypothetical protein
VQGFAPREGTVGEAARCWLLNASCRGLQVLEFGVPDGVPGAGSGPAEVEGNARWLEECWRYRDKGLLVLRQSLPIMSRSSASKESPWLSTLLLLGLHR